MGKTTPKKEKRKEKKKKRRLKRPICHIFPWILEFTTWIRSRKTCNTNSGEWGWAWEGAQTVCRIGVLVDQGYLEK